MIKLRKGPILGLILCCAPMTLAAQDKDAGQITKSLGLDISSIGGAGASKSGQLIYGGSEYDIQGRISLRDVVITHGNYEVEAEQMLIGDDTMSVVSGEMTSKDLGEESSVTFSSAAITGPGAAAFLSLEESVECAASDAAPEDALQAGLSIRGVEVIAPDTPGSFRGVRMPQTAERMSVDLISISTLVSTDEACIILPSISADGISMQAVSGANATIKSIRMASNPHPAKSKLAFGAVQIDDLSVMGADKDEVFGFSRFGAKVEASRGAISEVSDGRLLTKMSDAETMLRLMFNHDMGVHIAVTGLRLPAGGMLPDDLSEGSDLKHDITGDASWTISSPGETMSITQDINLKGIAKSIASVTFNINEEKDDTGAVSFASLDPRLSALSRLDLVKAEFSYSDQGVDEFLNEVAGIGVSDVIDVAETRAGIVPVEISEPSFDWMRQSAKDGGRVRFEPTSPIGLIQVGITAMMDPSGLGKALGVIVE